MKSTLKHPKFIFFMVALFVFGKTIAQKKITDITNAEGYVTAQYADSPEGEGIESIIDNQDVSKYLTFHKSGWIQFQQAQQSVVTKYTITSANDDPNRDPMNWTLSGSNDGATWTTLDKRTDEKFENRLQKKEFTFTNKTAYSYYRLNMEAHSGNVLQLAEWEIIGTGGGGMPPLPQDITKLGGLISAEIDNSPMGEDISKVIDNDTRTKFLAPGSSCWIQLQQANASVVTKYAITSANDVEMRDPHHWTFQGSNDGKTWTTLDTRSDEIFAERFLTKTFSFENNASYSYYRLNLFTDNFYLLQLAELQIFGLGGGGNPPPVTMKENHFNHTQTVTRVYNSPTLEVYYDEDLNVPENGWTDYLKNAWRYVNNIYGSFGPQSILQAHFHGKEYAGESHFSSYIAKSNNDRNIIDLGATMSKNSKDDLDLVTAQLSNLVAHAAKGYEQSPAQEIWKDKWTEIFSYDIYKGLGMSAEADRVYNKWINTEASFPKAGTYWFRDWFYPIYSNYGNSVVLDRFFAITAKHFPKNGSSYARQMNWGEFVHFWSGATGVNLKDHATKAFAWPAEWEQQFVNAQREFPFAYIPQRIIEKPVYSSRSFNVIDLVKVQLFDSTAVCHFEISYTNNGVNLGEPDVITLPDGKQIKSKYLYGAKTYKMVRPANPAAKYYYSVVFEGVDPSVSYIDYKAGHGWEISDVQLKKYDFMSPLPQELSGNWLTTDGSNQWVFGLHDKKAIYQNTVWDYERIEKKGKATVIHLKNKGHHKTIYAQVTQEGKLKLGESAKKLVDYGKTRTENPEYKAVDDEPYATHVFKHDTATYKGYIKGYRPRAGKTTGSVFVDNIITGGQDSYPIQIADDGSFEVKFPMNYPQKVFVRFDNRISLSVYVEPGAELFHFFDKAAYMQKPDAHSVFMGDCSRINQELLLLERIIAIDYDQVRRDVAVFSPGEYKKYILQQSDRKLAAFSEYKKKNFVSKKGAWYAENHIKFQAFSLLMEYNRVLSNASQLTKKVDSTPVQPDSSYYAFLKEISFNDERNIVVSGFITLLNRVQYADIFSPSSYSKIFKDMGNSGTIFTQEEKQAIDTLQQLETPGALPSREEAIKVASRNQKILDALFRKYLEILMKESINIKAKGMKNYFGIDGGLFNDIVLAQKLSNDLEAYKPFTEQQIYQLKNDISNPFITQTLLKNNANLITRIEKNKQSNTAVVNDMPKTHADGVFESIVDKYKGKAVLVDFWATWCGPCRVGIKNIAPLKDELANTDVAFVYITNESSPLESYNNMIPMIKGEHYRANGDEWNIISSRFNISGIPHYVLIDKEGRIVNENYSYHGNNEVLKKDLLDVAK